MSHQYYYFDGDEERETVANQIHDIRSEIIKLAEHVPEQHHFIPRYGGRSLASILMHLYLCDTVALWWIQWSANVREDLVIRPPLPLLRLANQVVLRFFTKRRVATTLRDIRRREGAICDYVRTVPIDVLHRDVYHPARREPYTVEQALQVYFVRYWQRHLSLMQQVEGVAGTPTEV